MADTEVEVTTAPLQTLADGGDLITLSDISDPQPRRQPVDEIAALAALAATAVQPSDLGSAATTDTSFWMSVEEHERVVAELVARIEEAEAGLGQVLVGGYIEVGYLEEGYHVTNPG